MIFSSELPCDEGHHILGDEQSELTSFSNVTIGQSRFGWAFLMGWYISVDMAQYFNRDVSAKKNSE
jgi:hypothetical protein